MWPRIFGLVWAAWLWLPSGGCGGSPQPKNENDTAEDVTVNETATINGRLFADPQNSSSLPVSGRISGDEVWFAPSVDPAGRQPLALGLHGENLVVSYGNLLAILNRRDGTPQWSNQIKGNHAFMLEEGGIVTLDHAGFFHLIGYDGQLKEELFLANVGNDTYLHFLQRADSVAVLCSEQFETPTSTPEDNPLPPVSRFVHYLPETMDVRWEYVLPPKLVGLVISRDGTHMYIADATRLFSFPTDGLSDDVVTEIEMTQIVSLAADGEGNGLVVDIAEDSTEIKQVKPDGTVGWTAKLEGWDVSRQPVASAPDGGVYVAAANTLYRIRDGRIEWSYRLAAATEDIAITVLNDNSVLAAAGQALVHVSESGEEIITKWLDTPITTRPIMDENGTVYYGGSDGIHCLR
jgi:hypothetical protein